MQGVTYDAWGRVPWVKDANSVVITDTNHIGYVNPIRYRSYYYDNETGFYYLQSRYYDPVIGRFINADGYASTGTGFVGYNMFAYCGNNPVERVDPGGTCYYSSDGTWWHDRWEYLDGYVRRQSPNLNVEYEEVHGEEDDDLNDENLNVESEEYISIQTTEDVHYYYNLLSEENYYITRSVVGFFSGYIDSDFLGMIGNVSNLKNILSNSVPTDTFGNELYIEKGYGLIEVSRIYIWDTVSCSETQYILYDHNGKCVFNKAIINSKISD